jgi:hypothetical protein
MPEFKFADGAGEGVEAFADLPRLLVEEPDSMNTQMLLQRFIRSVAYKNNMSVLNLKDVDEKTFTNKNGFTLKVNWRGDSVVFQDPSDPDEILYGARNKSFHGCKITGDKDNQSRASLVTLDSGDPEYDTDGYDNGSGSVTIPPGLGGYYHIVLRVYCVFDEDGGGV